MMMDIEQTRYLEPSQELGRVFASRGIAGSVVMLNLLRFREVADYSAHPGLAPPAAVSGADAYQRYIDHTLPHLRRLGGELLFLGDCRNFLIGPPGERWDMAMLVRQHSVEAFLSFASDEAYLTGIGHRVAALEDSRLLPLIESAPLREVDSWLDRFRGFWEPRLDALATEIARCKRKRRR